MAKKKKKTNAILEEQRRARQEFLELKKMQSGEMAAEPKPSEIAIVPKTFGEKTANFWYHYKWAVIVGVFVATILTVCVVQCAQKVDPDMKIVLYSLTYADENGVKKAAQPYAADVNKDGKKRVEIVNCSFNEQTENLYYSGTMRQKMNLMLSVEEDTILFICDQAGYENMLEQFSDTFTGEPKKLNEAFYKAAGTENLPPDLMVLCSDISGKRFRKNKTAKQQYKEAQAFLAAYTDSE
ncbi:MAG: hypothetical protein MJ132_02640 [Clostridia bacterium]|nr:hypothetical protein [Clostridia bacterium]